MKQLIAFAALLAALLAADRALAASKIGACGSTITASGSYVVTRSLTPKSGSAAPCITVNASNVTIDLGGYHIDCNSSGFSCIEGANGTDGVTIRNGMIANCTSAISAPGATGLLVDKVLAISNSVEGIRVGPKSTVVHCIAFNNGGGGIIVECPSNVTGNTAAANTFGIVLDGTGCNSTKNGTQ